MSEYFFFFKWIKLCLEFSSSLSHEYFAEFSSLSKKKSYGSFFSVFPCKGGDQDRSGQVYVDDYIIYKLLIVAGRVCQNPKHFIF